MYLLRNLVVVIFLGLVPAVLVCALAGRWDLWNVWTTAGIFLAWNVFQTLVAYRKHPAVLKERMNRMRPGTGGRVHRIAVRALVGVIILQWIIAGLDHRIHWSDRLPSAVVVTGLVLFTISWGLATWATLVNPDVSREIRVHAALGQRVAHEGPYAVIRHPSFALISLAVLASGLALDSLVAVIPAIVLAGVMVPLTATTDQMRREELPWYAAYAAKVRYRLVPGLW
jgi:protein-S-isoprenylcysteine O-methyltransferase Ste14